MLSTVEMIEKARHLQGDVSDYRIAKLLGIKPSLISTYRHTPTKPSNPVVMRLAELSGVDPAEAVAAVNLERATTPEDREVWEIMLARLTASAKRKKAA
jgi:predicted transcriptional regulator